MHPGPSLFTVGRMGIARPWKVGHLRLNRISRTTPDHREAPPLLAFFVYPKRTYAALSGAPDIPQAPKFTPGRWQGALFFIFRW